MECWSIDLLQHSDRQPRVFIVYLLRIPGIGNPRTGLATSKNPGSVSFHLRLLSVLTAVFRPGASWW